MAGPGNSQTTGYSADTAKRHEADSAAQCDAVAVLVPAHAGGTSFTCASWDLQ